tara:strand:+ start:256 stop:573 length:318 start_codon:yes stop_codon:yes gene_type:complete
MEGFIPLILIFVLMYMFLIRPQQKKVKAQQQLVRSIQPGDEVLLNSGIYGVVNEVDDDVVWLEVSQDLELKVLRTAVERRLTENTDEVDEVVSESEDPDNETDED